MLNNESMKETFKKFVVEAVFSVRENNATSWVSAKDAEGLDSTQFAKPNVTFDKDSEIFKLSNGDKVVKDNGKWVRKKDGFVYAYEHPSVEMTTSIDFDGCSLEKMKNEAMKSLIITAQKLCRAKGTKWCLENATGKTFVASELTKGRVKLSKSERVEKLMNGGTVEDIDAAIAKLKELRSSK